MFRHDKSKLNRYLNNGKPYAFITILVAGAYPLLYYYDKNYALINSKSQFVFLVSLYVLIPLLFYYLLNFVFMSVTGLKKLRRYLLPVFNLSWFFLTVVISLYGFNFLKLVSALILGFALGIVLAKHIKKVLILQFILIGLVLPKLIPDLYREVFYSKEWMKQPDDIETAVFAQRPNIYVIQPDGYVNFSTFKDSVYNYDNNKFKTFLELRGFKTYDDYRSNYFSTLSSNSSLFSMKHHYYGNKTLGINSSHNATNEIVESNSVLRTFKHNKYKTFLMLQVPYLLSNRPSIDFDYCNISLDDISYIDRGFSVKTDLIEDTKNAIKSNSSTTNFFFIESMLPSHITTHFNPSSSIENEREQYLTRIEKANDWLIELVKIIESEDPEGIIIIIADHGGYVGLNSSMASETKVFNPLLKNSMFSSLLAIKWPKQIAPNYDDKLKTSVNLFRIMFSYLSDDQSYLKNLQDDKSYIIVRNGAPTAVYEYIDEFGNKVFKRFSPN